MKLHNILGVFSLVSNHSFQWSSFSESRLMFVYIWGANAENIQCTDMSICVEGLCLKKFLPTVSQARQRENCISFWVYIYIQYIHTVTWSNVAVRLIICAIFWYSALAGENIVLFSCCITIGNVLLISI